MEQRLHIGPPEAGSEREKEFESSVQYMRNAVLNVVNRRRDGIESQDIPFIDALLQTQVPDKQVKIYSSQFLKSLSAFISVLVCKIVADSLSFMVGGFHTSGYHMVWFIHYMSLYPEVRKKVIQEMTEEVGDDRGDKLKNYVHSTDRYEITHITHNFPLS